MDDLGGDRGFVPELALLDAVQDADGPDRVLVHRIGVVHVVLHLRHDPAERRNQAAEHTGLVHPPERDIGRPGRGQHVQEQFGGFRPAVEAEVDPAQVPRHLPERRRVDVQFVALRLVEQPQHGGRVLGEGLLLREGEPAAFGGERPHLPVPGQQPGEGEQRLASVLVLQRGAEDARQVAHLLRL